MDNTSWEKATAFESVKSSSLYFEFVLTTVYSVQHTVWTALCSVKCQVASVQFTVYSLKFVVYSVQCKVCSIQCSVQYALKCTVCILLCGVNLNIPVTFPSSWQIWVPNPFSGSQAIYFYIKRSNFCLFHCMSNHNVAEARIWWSFNGNLRVKNSQTLIVNIINRIMPILQPDTWRYFGC